MSRWTGRRPAGNGRHTIGGMALGAALLVLGADASASTSLAATWDGLLHDSSAVAVVTALDAHGVWENGRIYTYTHVHVDRAVCGELPTGAEAYIRTMGGEVGNVGQRVEGEASFQGGAPSLVFMHPGPPGAFVVTARGQGQFAVVPGEGSAPARLQPGSSLGALVRPQQTTGAAPRLALEAVRGRVVDDVARDVTSDWPRLHSTTWR
jgi:hypothetical protein